MRWSKAYSLVKKQENHIFIVRLQVGRRGSPASPSSKGAPIVHYTLGTAVQISKSIRSYLTRSIICSINHVIYAVWLIMRIDAQDQSWLTAFQCHTWCIVANTAGYTHYTVELPCILSCIALLTLDTAQPLSQSQMDTDSDGQISVAELIAWVKKNSKEVRVWCVPYLVNAR